MSEINKGKGIPRLLLISSHHPSFKEHVGGTAVPLLWSHVQDCVACDVQRILSISVSLAPEITAHWVREARRSLEYVSLG